LRERVAHQCRRQLVGIEEIEAVSRIEPMIALGEGMHLGFRTRAADLRYGKRRSVTVE